MGETQVKEGLRHEVQDHTLALHSQSAVKERMLYAIEDVLALHFGCDLLIRPIRTAIEYRLRITTNGSNERPIRTLQAIADRHKLDLQVSFQEGDRLELIMYPRA